MWVLHRVRPAAKPDTVDLGGGRTGCLHPKKGSGFCAIRFCHAFKRLVAERRAAEGRPTQRVSTRERAALARPWPPLPMPAALRSSRMCSISSMPPKCLASLRLRVTCPVLRSGGRSAYQQQCSCSQHASAPPAAVRGAATAPPYQQQELHVQSDGIVALPTACLVSVMRARMCR